MATQQNEHLPPRHAQAVETAADLKFWYGERALVGAKAAYGAAAQIGDPDAIELWSEVCAILASDQQITIL